MKLKRWKLIFRLLFNDESEYGFDHNVHLSDVIAYALNNYESKRGDGASDVLLYDRTYGRDILGGEKLKKWKLIARVLFNNKNKIFGYKHNDHLCNIIKYALDNHESKKGDGFGCVHLYNLCYGRDVLGERIDYE